MAGRAKARNAALRTLFESGAPVELLAAATGRKVEPLRAMARREKWRENEGDLSDAERMEFLRRAADRLLRRIDLNGKAKGKTERLGKAEIDEILTAVRTVQRISEMVGAKGDTTQRREYSDAEIAAALERINKRIVELARQYGRVLAERALRARNGAGARP